MDNKDFFNILDKNNIKYIIGKEKTHYIKFCFHKKDIHNKKHDISIRYHYLWQNNPKYEGKWVIKDHQEKITQIIDEKLAIRIIEDLSGNNIQFEEIIGFVQNGEYTKKIINKSGKHINKLINDSKLEKKHFKRISNKIWKKKKLVNENKTVLLGIFGNYNYFITYKHLVDNEHYFNLKIFKSSIIRKENDIEFFDNLTFEELKQTVALKSNTNINKLYFPSEKKLLKKLFR